MDVDKIWVTAKSRIQAEKRFLALATHSQCLLIWYSLCSIAVSVYYLKFDSGSEYSDIIWVEVSILVLFVSLVIQYSDYNEKASLMKECHIQLSALYNTANSKDEEERDTTTLAQEYEQILAVCDNHKQIDYFYFVCETYLITPHSKRKDLSCRPTTYIVTNFIFSKLLKTITLGLLYLVPIFLFYFTGSL